MTFKDRYNLNKKIECYWCKSQILEREAEMICWDNRVEEFEMVTARKVCKDCHDAFYANSYNVDVITLREPTRVEPDSIDWSDEDEEDI